MDRIINFKDLKKGSLGRVAVVGGSRSYTGAPYFAAKAALRCFAELVYIYCENDIVLKPLLPDCIITRYYGDENIKNWPFGHTLINTYVVGCGLGKSDFSYFILQSLISWDITSNTDKSKDNKINIILDGDALMSSLTESILLWAIKQPVNLIMSCNKREFNNITKILESDSFVSLNYTFPNNLPDNFFIISKGYTDVIYSAEATETINHKIVNCRRPGGLGDILAGIIAGLIASNVIPDITSCIKLNTIASYIEGKPSMCLSYTASDLFEILPGCFYDTITEQLIN